MANWEIQNTYGVILVELSEVHTRTIKTIVLFNHTIHHIDMLWKYFKMTKIDNNFSIKIMNGPINIIYAYFDLFIYNHSHSY